VRLRNSLLHVRDIGALIATPAQRYLANRAAKAISSPDRDSSRNRQAAFGNGTQMGWERRVYHQDPWAAVDARDRRDVADEIETKVVVERRVERVNRRNLEQRIAVWGRTDDGFGGHIAAGARPVLDDEWLPETLRQRLTDKACKEVRRATKAASRRSTAPAASDRFAPLLSAIQPGARPQPRLDARICGGEISS
jgi:hypothetical protein